MGINRAANMITRVSTNNLPVISAESYEEGEYNPQAVSDFELGCTNPKPDTARGTITIQDLWLSIQQETKNCFDIATLVMLTMTRSKFSRM